MTTKPEPIPTSGGSTFASRRAAREADEAAGVTPPERRVTSLRAGIDAPQHNITEVNRVRA